MGRRRKPKPENMRKLGPYSTAFGIRMRLRRRQLEMTQEELADLIDTWAPMVLRWEHGLAPVTIDRAYPIARALGVSLDWLAGVSDEEMGLLDAQL